MSNAPALPAPPIQAAITDGHDTLEERIDAAAELLRGLTFAILTGAGVSTDSGIPDYRGEGAQVRAPMTFQQFISDSHYRKRYWAGSHLGWQRFSQAQPNVGHRVIAELEDAGLLNGVITQNVDGLHARAGSRHIVDLHGTMDRVRCLGCDQMYARDDIAARMSADNPWLDTPGSVELAPDGDVNVPRIDDFRIPDCSVCSGTLKPEIVFFGEYVPTEKFQEAKALVHSADALIVAGSSLVVNSGIRLVVQANKRRKPVIVINRGVTKGDANAALKIEAGATETLLALQERLAR